MGDYRKPDRMLELMLRKRLLAVIVIIPIGASVIVAGGIIYTLFIAIVMGIAAWEFVRIYKTGGATPATWLVYIGVILLVISRAVYNFAHIDGLLTLLVLCAMAFHLISYERGNDHAATDFSVTICAIIYVGWMGAYFISLRNIPDGKWWLLLAIPAVGLADTGAYFIGSKFGRHKLSPRLSPNKTWEGIIGEIIFGAVGGLFLGYLWNIACPAITPLRGAILGTVLAVLTPLGDLGESMIKRQFNVKDSSNIIPGHGGVLDRIDSWIWAVPITFYIVQYFWL
jgi:phosphatidate cytidylyltransferase